MEELLRKYEQFEKSQNPAYLHTKSLAEILDSDYQIKKPIIKDMLYEGLYILAGSPKIGKSFLSAEIAYCIATGTPIWGNKTCPSTVLVLSLEDDYERIANRMYRMHGYSEDTTLEFSVTCKTLSSGLEDQIEYFISEYPDTKLVIIDTLQKVRSKEGHDYSYASDYRDMTLLKQLSFKLHIAILLIHHTRKTSAEDCFDMISGTNGLFGAADGAYILHKPNRNEPYAYLDIAGRDIPSKQLYLYHNPETLIWELASEEHIVLSPPNPILESLSLLVTPDAPKWTGTATDLLRETGINMNANTLSTHLNLHKSELFNDYSILFERTRTCTGRHITLTYIFTE